MNDFMERFKEVREQTRKEVNKRRGIAPPNTPPPMNKLPLSPTDVTEFTCDPSKDLSMLAKRRSPDFRQDGANAAIAAEWSHRIAEEYARHVERRKFLAGVTRAEQEQLAHSAAAYVAWLDSLKGGQNAQ